MPLMKAILPILAIVEWPSAAVAIALIAFLALVMYIALKRFEMDDILKFWAALGTIVGLIIGTFGTYFFTREVTQAKVQTVEARSAAEIGSALSAFRAASNAVKTKLSPE